MDITIARITQLVFRLVMLALVGKAGVDSHAAAGIAQPASELAGAGLALLVDLFIHSARFGAIAKFFESLADSELSIDDSGTVSAHSAPLTTSTTSTGNLAKAAKFGFLLFAILFALVGTGCASSEQRKWAQGQQSLTNVETALTDAHADHILNDRDIVDTKPYVDAAQAYLDQWHTNWKAGVATPTSTLANLNAALANLFAALATAQHNTAATQPSATAP